MIEYYVKQSYYITRFIRKDELDTRLLLFLVFVYKDRIKSFDSNSVCGCSGCFYSSFKDQIFCFFERNDEKLPLIIF